MSFRKQGSNTTRKMQTKKPTMLNCSKDVHIIFEVFSFNIWVRHWEEVIRGLEKTDGKFTN
jgi:hypothetical protein